MRRELKLLAGIAVMAMEGSCVLFTDLGGFSQGETAAPSNDGGNEDATTLPLSDADSVTDAPSGGGSDVDAPVIINPGDPCSDPRSLIGRSNLTGLVEDGIPPYSVDAYPFQATVAGSARCVWIYIQDAPPSKKVRIGLYTDDAAEQHPKNLVVGVELKNVTPVSWNKMALPNAITINVGDKYWLAVSPTKREDDGGGPDRMSLRFLSGACGPPYAHAAGVGETGPLPQVFNPDTTFNGDCDGAVYLGP